MRTIRWAIPVALLCLCGVSACSSAPEAAGTPEPTKASVRPPSAGTPAQRPSTTPPSPKRPSAHPPVTYTPSWPERTARTEAGYLVNTCVPASLRDSVTTLTTSDGVHLSALELGDGPDGVLLDHEQGYNICSFVDIGKQLASRGYHVVIPEYRNHGASEHVADNEHIDRDARAGLAELKRLGAERVFLGGASCGGTTAAVAGADGELPVVGLLMMSSPARCGGVDAVAAVRKIDAPSLFAVSPGDMEGAVEKQVREVYAASAATQKRLIIDQSGYHGTDMIRRGPRGAALERDVVSFVVAAYDKAR
ncbi:alpha/beta fold hydrolase [Streptomyces sp. NPDC002574]|uniref:alpha/beta fold hydrolase n=1 Tax=Streptomyces sp. NPDC002574 TaxID=3364652 RepID=UPI00369EC979